jgi:hypothetical protein
MIRERVEAGAAAESIRIDTQKIKIKALIGTRRSAFCM